MYAKTNFNSSTEGYDGHEVCHVVCLWVWRVQDSIQYSLKRQKCYDNTYHSVLQSLLTWCLPRQWTFTKFKRMVNIWNFVFIRTLKWLRGEHEESSTGKVHFRNYGLKVWLWAIFKALLPKELTGFTADQGYRIYKHFLTAKCLHSFHWAIIWEMENPQCAGFKT